MSSLDGASLLFIDRAIARGGRPEIRDYAYRMSLASSSDANLSNNNTIDVNTSLYPAHITTNEQGKPT
jgi:hypothetical protein